MATWRRGSAFACGQSWQNLSISKQDKASIISLMTPVMCWMCMWMLCCIERTVNILTKAIMVLLWVEALAMICTTDALLQ